MREAYSRSLSSPQAIKRVRRTLKISCGRGNLRSGLSRIAHAYGLVNENGSPRDAEILRLLLTTALTADQPDHVRMAVTYALASQRPMIVAEMGRRITRRYATGPSKWTAWTRGGQRTDVRANQARVTLDDVLFDALQSIAFNWQDDRGIVRDNLMIAQVAEAGLNDPDLPEILGWYMQEIGPLRERLAQVEQHVHAILAEAMGMRVLQETG